MSRLDPLLPAEAAGLAAKEAAEGVDGLVVPDLPVEKSGPLARVCEAWMRRTASSPPRKTQVGDRQLAIAKPPAPVPQEAEPQLKTAMELELSMPTFNGPLALLLDLIERRKLPITEVSLADVADQYLERMRTLVGIDPEILADFLVIAAKLLVIKSRELLPSPSIHAEEEPDVAEELKQRLLEYRLFREAAELLRERENAGLRSYTRQTNPDAAPLVEPPLEPIQPEALRSAMIRMLKALKLDSEPLPRYQRATVQQRIGHLLDALSYMGRAVFAELSGTKPDEIVATFLALLELLRLGRVLAEQEYSFGDIAITLVPAQ